MSDVLRIPNKVLISTFNIDFSYTTRRNNKKQRAVEIKSINRQDAEYWFNNWLEKFNSENPHKAYSNVQILGCAEINRELIEI